jgi:hypothetical protein
MITVIAEQLKRAEFHSEKLEKIAVSSADH